MPLTGTFASALMRAIVVWKDDTSLSCNNPKYSSVQVSTRYYGYWLYFSALSTTISRSPNFGASDRILAQARKTKPAAARLYQHLQVVNEAAGNRTVPMRQQLLTSIAGSHLQAKTLSRFLHACRPHRLNSQ